MKKPIITFNAFSTLTSTSKCSIPNEKEVLLKEPDWAKEASKSLLYSSKDLKELSKRPKCSNSFKISRVGSAPKPEESPILQEIKLKAKALQEGMSILEMNNADAALDRAFGLSDRKFRKLF